MDKKVLIAVDAEACISCGLCLEIAPKIFILDEQMKSEVIEKAEINLEILMEATRSCPTKAITVAN